MSRDPVRLINLTPHEVTLFAEEGARLVLPPAGGAPRLILGEGSSSSIEATGPAQAQGAQESVTIRLTYGEHVQSIDPPLPAPQGGVLYVTSRVVAEQHPERTDLVWPNELVRDGAGRPAGARALSSLHAPRTTKAES